MGMMVPRAFGMRSLVLGQRDRSGYEAVREHWRQVRGMTQPELAEKAEIEQSYLSKLENGHSQPSEGVRDRLAEALGIDVDTLMRDPSSNGHLRRRLAIGLSGIALLIAGFAAGYVASDYEVRKVNREGARLETVWSLAPAGIEIETVMFSDAREGAPASGNVVGTYEDPSTVRTYASRLLDSGLLGNKLGFVKLSGKHGFVIWINGDRLQPDTSGTAQPISSGESAISSIE